MGERKVLNKFIPWDFDVNKIVKVKRESNRLRNVTNMLPMNIRCSKCGEFMYKGTKFNTKMEQIQGYTYKGIDLFRFYYRCTNCRGIFIIRTDPENGDYAIEGGATRNFELWRERIRLEEDEKKRLQEADRDSMVALEQRTIQSKLEMEQNDQIDEIKAMNAKRNVGKDIVFDKYFENDEKKDILNEDDLKEIEKLYKENENNESDGDDDAFWNVNPEENENKEITPHLEENALNTHITVKKKTDKKEKKHKKKYKGLV